jgi:hypothetical protein
MPACGENEKAPPVAENPGGSDPGSGGAPSDTAGKGGTEPSGGSANVAGSTPAGGVGGDATPSGGSGGAAEVPPVDTFCGDDSPNEESGSILFTHWLSHRGTLRLFATFPDLSAMAGYDPASTAKLEVRFGEDGAWKEVASADILEQIGAQPLWVARFEVQAWDERLCAKYRVTYDAPPPLGGLFTGRILRNPTADEEVVVATANCYGKKDEVGIEAEAIKSVETLTAREPDLLFLAGDQVYGNDHFEEWRSFGRQFKNLLRAVPTVAIADDHDVGQGNLWGSVDTEDPSTNARSTSGEGDAGGYTEANAYVNVSELSQSGVLPAAPDYGDGVTHGAPVPFPNDIDLSVYYTALNWGGLSFAILEDRKFKEGPQEVLKLVNANYLTEFKAAFPDRWDHLVNGASSLPPAFSEQAAELLGSRQEAFLEKWTEDWSQGAQMKVVLSQTPFAGFSTHHGRTATPLEADLDANGWPKSGRDSALRLMRKGFAFHVAGDQHLGGLLHYGVDDWEDAGYVYIVPSVNSVYGRQWWPDKMINRSRAGQPEAWPAGQDPIYHGRFLDGFNNQMTVWAHAQGDEEGVGYLTFNKKLRTITTYFVKRGVVVPKGQQPPPHGLTKTIDQLANYGRKPTHFLPTLKFNLADPVVQVVDESTQEVVYTLRVSGTQFAPQVFKAGNYSVRITRDSFSAGVQTLSAQTASPGANAMSVGVTL